LIHLSRRKQPAGSGPATSVAGGAGYPAPTMGAEPDAPVGPTPVDDATRPERLYGAADPGNVAPPGAVPPPATAAWWRRRRSRWLAAAAVALVVILVAAGLYAGRSGPSPVSRPPTTAVPSGLAGGAPATFAVYPGDGTAAQEVDDVKALAKVLGRRIPTVVVMTDTRSLAAFQGSVFGHFLQAGGWKDFGPGKPSMVVSVPLAFGGFTPTQAVAKDGLEMAAEGKYDLAYRYLAHSMVSAGYPDSIIRLGWEFDGNWMPWTAQGNAAAYVAAYRHVHDVLAAVSPGFRFDWTSAGGYESVPRAGTYQWQGAMDWTDAYPGDAYVDIVGVDLYDENQGQAYDQSTGTWKDPAAVWRYESTPLTVVRDFAIAHYKQVSYPEWGLSDGGSVAAGDNGGDNPAFVQGMADWFASLPRTGPGSLAYQSYFQGTTQTDGIHAIGHFPKSYRLFRTLFGS
jgi:hypothetical protein